MGEGDLQAAVAAGALAAREGHGPLLHAIVEVARAIFAARAASIMLLDDSTGELVFEAVAGEGEEVLIGHRIPAGVGIAGWVAESGQPLVVEDVSADPRFAADQARRTGYVPKGLMSAPLARDERLLGVLNVLDRPERRRFSVAEMDLLALFANQAAIALDLLLHARRIDGIIEGAEDEIHAVARLATTLEGLQGNRRAAGFRLLGEITAVLGG